MNNIETQQIAFYFIANSNYLNYYDTDKHEVLLTDMEYSKVLISEIKKDIEKFTNQYKIKIIHFSGGLINIKITDIK